jgi:iron complex outermembrane receptor protein
MSIIQATDLVHPADVAAGISIAELIDDMPGVSLTGQGGSLQSYAIRGLSKARIQTRIEGVPLYTERRAGNSATFIDPFLIETISVSKGPASTLYGSNAIGGVVALESKKFHTPELIASYYSNGDRTMLGAGVGNDKISLGFAHRKHQRSEAVKDTRLNDGLERSSMIFTAEYSLADDLKFQVSTVAADAKNIGKSSSDYPDKRITIYPEEQHLLARATLRTSDWVLNIWGHDQSIDTRVQRNSETTQTKATSLDFGSDWIGRWSTEKLKYRMGVEWIRRTSVTVKEYPGGSAPFYSLNGHQESSALFADGEYSTHNWLLYAGLRYNHISQTGFSDSDHDSAVTGSLAARYLLGDQWTIFARLSRGFRFPELQEKFFAGTTGRGQVTGSPDLVSEFATNIEFGISLQRSKLSFESAIYRMKVDDYIERTMIGVIQLSFRNVSDGTIQGVEARLDYRLGNLSVNLGGHRLRGKDENGNSLADIPAAEVNLGLRYTDDWGQVQLTYQHRFGSNRVHVDEVAHEQANLISIAMVFPVGDKGELTLWGKNLRNDDFLLTSDPLSPVSTKRGVGATILWQF